MKQLYKLVQRSISLLSLAIILSSCQGDSNKIVDQNNPPDPKTVSATISSPASGESFAQEQVIVFSGSAVLGSSGQIAEENLVWSSDKDGVIGVGYGFKRSGLSVDNHTITLTAAAPSGESGTATVQLINQPAANGITVLIDSPAGSRIKSYEPVSLRGSAAAPDGAPVTEPLAFEWRSDLEINPGAVLGDGLQIMSAGLTPGLHTITLTAAVPDGNGGIVTGSASINLFVEFENTGITFDILEPANGFQNLQGQDLVCSGSGSISNGGSFESIVWTSSMDGEIGSSETCIVPYLSLGTHRITVTATAMDGKKGAASIIVEVVE